MAGESPPDAGLIEAWLQGSLADLTGFLPFVVLMALILWRSGVGERGVIREELAFRKRRARDECRDPEGDRLVHA
jgi:hypothetical protein